MAFGLGVGHFLGWSERLELQVKKERRNFTHRLGSYLQW